MTKRRQDALAATAARGGTENERQTAQNKLRETLAIRNEDCDDVWTGQGVLARNRNGNRAYLRGSALRHFLVYVSDGVYFNVRSVPMSEDFGTGDFYVVLSWLLKHNLCIKTGSRYTVTAKASVRRAWNQVVEQMKL